MITKYTYSVVKSTDDILHYGILGQKWGVRRYQNEDGSLTSAGKERYKEGGSSRSGGLKGVQATTESGTNTWQPSKRSGGLRGIKTASADDLNNRITQKTSNIPMSVVSTYGLPKSEDESKTFHVNPTGWYVKEVKNYSNLQPETYDKKGIMELAAKIMEQQKVDHQNDPSWDPEKDPDYGTVTCDTSSSLFRKSELWKDVAHAVEKKGVEDSNKITGVKVQAADDYPFIIVSYWDGKQVQKFSMELDAISEMRANDEAWEKSLKEVNKRRK